MLAALANSDVANITNQIGTALANLLPNRVGLDVLRYNYTQAFLPGLITAATGLSYEPCLISAGLTGAVVGNDISACMPVRPIARMHATSSLYARLRWALAACRMSDVMLEALHCGAHSLFFGCNFCMHSDAQKSCRQES